MGFNCYFFNTRLFLFLCIYFLLLCINFAQKLFYTSTSILCFDILISASMYRARTVLNNLVPFIPSAAGPERFASWLLGSSGSRALCVSSSRRYNAPVASEPFLNGSSGAYVEEMYNAWLADPKSVHAVSFFNFQFNHIYSKGYLSYFLV